MTPQQLAALKAAIVADSALNSQPMTSDGAFAIAAALNAPSNPAANVWRPDASVQAINDAIDYTKYTPTDAADNTVTYSNRLLLVQTKQMNLQNMLIGRDTVDASRSNVRSALRDAVINLPTGASGANVSAGGASGVNVMNACVRQGKRIEIVMKTGDATTGGVTAAVMGFEGDVSYQEVEQARALP